MKVRKMNIKKLDSTGSSAEIQSINEESFVIPNEAACSPEFTEGCIIMEDEA